MQINPSRHDEYNPDDVKIAADLLAVIGHDTVLRRVAATGGGEYAGPCPFCAPRGGADSDGFRVWPVPQAGKRPGWMCRKCTPAGGSAIDYVMRRDGVEFGAALEALAVRFGVRPVSEVSGLDRAAAADVRKIERLRLAAAAGERAEAARLERLRHLEAAYNEAALVAALMACPYMAELEAGGVTRAAARHFGFGFDARRYGGALTIPWRRDGVLQYRLVNSQTGDRYRWESGASGRLFNAEIVIKPNDDDVIIVEGAKKAACVWGYVESVAAVPNKTSAERIVTEFAGELAQFRRVYLALDPDATASAYNAARALPNARIVELPVKIDDWLVGHAGDMDHLGHYLRYARRVG